MNKSYKKLSAWMILVGLFLQISTPVVAAMRASNSSLPNMVIPGTVGVPVKMRSSELESSVDVANFNVQGLIEHVVEDAVEQGCENALSSALLRCYKSVSEGETVIDVDTLIEAMPELLEYAVTQEKMRAVRPDAPLATANNAIVACGGDCDLTQLIRLLASIRARIGTVNDNPCCGTILGILGDACNVPCIGEDGSISEVLCEILNCCTTTAADIKGIFTVLVDIKDTLTECCAEIKQEIFDTQTLIIEGFEATWTMIEDCCACGPIPLFQSDVVGGVINLTTTGLNYCLAENVTGNIAITGANVTVDGNDRVVTGRIFIDAEDVIFKNTKVKTPAAGDNAEAAFAGIHATSISLKVQILNCLVECADSVVGVNARTGIFSDADETVIEQCNITGGNGNVNGFGIFINGNNAAVENSIATGSGIGGGVGIFILGDNGLIQNSTGSGTGDSGFGIFIQGDNGLIENSIGSGIGTSFGFSIFLRGTTIIVKSCSVISGSHTGIFVQAACENIQICECKVDGVVGDGIFVANGAECVQVVSNRVSCCGGTGINNLVGTEATFFNNIVTDCNPNYVNVPLIRVPGPHTGFFTNVTQGPQDCDLCDLFTVIADIKDTITECCAEIKLEIFNTQTLIVEGFEGTWTMIDDCCACGPIPLFQSDADAGGGVINLTTTGLNYCLAENITGNIIVTGANVTVEGNDRVLIGRVYINAADVILKNIKIRTPTATNNPEALNAGVEVTANGAKAQILNCLVECANSVVTINARNGIHCVADNIIIERCNVTGGDGSGVGAGIFIVGTNGLIKNSTGTGKGDNGYGIVIEGNNGHIENSNGLGAESDISYGICVQGNSGLIRNSTGTAAGGFDDYGVYIIGNNGLIENSIGTATGTVISYGVYIVGNNGLIEDSIGNGTGDLNGFGISIDGDFGLIKSSVGTAFGNSNGYGIYLSGNDNSIISSSGTGTRTEAVAGTYGAGIYFTGLRGLIEDSTAKGIATNDGYGIFIEGRVIAIKGCSVIGGGSIAGIYIEVDSSSEIQICDCKIDKVDGSGIIANNVRCMQIFNTQVFSSRNLGYFISGRFILIQGCSAVCNLSHGFRFGAASRFNLNNVTAVSNGSDGISLLNSDRFQIRNCHSADNGAAGYSVSSSSIEGLFLSNSAHLNATYGFSNNPVNTIFVNNIATNNSVADYGGTNPPGTFPISDTAGYWSNVRP